MSFQLIVRLTGLCVYILKDDKEDGNVMRVIMPGDPGDTMGMPMEPHVPALVFDPKYLDASNERPYEDFHNGQKTTYFCRLYGQDLTIGFKKAALKPDLTPIKRPCPRPDTDEESLLWVARIPDILSECGSGYGDVDPCCLDATNVPSTVAARVRLTEGRLYTSKIFAKGNLPVVWAAGHCQQAFAEELTLKLTVNQDSLSLVTTSFLVDSKYLPLTLKPRDDKLKIRIVNLPEDDLKEARAPETIVPGGPRKSDRRFQMLYSLSFQGVPNGHAPIPFPLRLCDKPLQEASGPVAGNPQCPGGGYNPHPGA